MNSVLPLRVALGLGDQELEQRLRPALDADAELSVAAHCLAADQVLQALESAAVDAIVVAWGLHRLSEAVISELERARLPVVLLAPSTTPHLEKLQRITLLPLDVDTETLRAAIKLAARGERWRPPRARREMEASAPASPPEAPAAALQIFAIAGGSGSPGRTTLAINLATALGAVASTVLVDLDCATPCVAAYLNRDPSRNVCTLAHAVREDPHGWSRALDQELQALHSRSPRSVVLCGLPKRELRPSVTPAIMEQLVEQLARRFRYVILDVGAELLGMDAPAIVHRAALSVAQHVLLVTGCDLVSLWHARLALSQLERTLSIDRERVSLIPNRHDGHFHHSAAEIEWHLGAAVAMVVPNDYRALQRAVAEQSPVVLDPHSRAARAMLRLAERIHQGRVRLAPDEAERPSRPSWRATLPAAVGGLLRWGGPT